jgi:uncharacterized membrane protein YfcA
VFDKVPKAVDFVSQSDVPVEHLPLIVATLTFLIAGFVIGLGLPTVSMGLLSLVMAPAKAASLLIVPSFVTNVWQLAAGPSFGRLARRLWPMLAGVVVGTLAGTGSLTGSHAGQAATALGVLLVLYAVLGLTSVRFSAAPTAEWWLGPLIGALTGLATAATGVFAIPAVPYLGALNLDKEDMIQALGLSFTVSTIALAASLAAGGAFALGDIGASTAALAPALLGMAAGGRVARPVQRADVSAGVLRRIACTRRSSCIAGGALMRARPRATPYPQLFARARIRPRIAQPHGPLSLGSKLDQFDGFRREADMLGRDGGCRRRRRTSVQLGYVGYTRRGPPVRLKASYRRPYSDHRCFWEHCGQSSVVEPSNSVAPSPGARLADGRKGKCG